MSAVAKNRTVRTLGPGPSFEGSAGARIKELELEVFNLRACLDAVTGDARHVLRVAKKNPDDGSAVSHGAQAADTLAIIERFFPTESS